MPRDTASTSAACGHIKETFAATPSSTSLRTLLLHAVLHQYQVTSCEISSLEYSDRGGHLRPTSTGGQTVYQHRPRVVCKLHFALYGLRTSPKMWQEHLNATLRGMQLHQLKSNRCVWVKKDIIVSAYVDDLLIAGTSRDTALFLEQPRQSFSLKHSTVLRSQQPLTLFGKRICRHPNGDITVSLESSYYYSMLKHMDLYDDSNPTSTSSLRRPPLQQDSPLYPDRHLVYRRIVGMLIWASQVRPDLQFTAKGHTRHLSSPTEWYWTHLKHSLRYIKGTMRYKFLISPRLPQGHSLESLPLRQLLPLNINTYCGSDWATDIDSRKSTSGSYLSTSGTSAELRAQSLRRQQKPSCTPSASASATAYTSTSCFKNFNIIFKSLPSTSATLTLSTTSLP